MDIWRVVWGPYTQRTYHLCDPNVSKNLATFGPKFMMPSTCYPSLFLQTTDIPPDACYLSMTPRWITLIPVMYVSHS